MLARVRESALYRSRIAGIGLLFVLPLSLFAEKPVLRVLSFYDEVSENAGLKLREFELAMNCWVEWDYRYHYELEELEFKNLEDYDIVTVDDAWIPAIAHKLLPLNEWPEARVIKTKKNLFIDGADSLGEWDDTIYGKPIVFNLYLYAYRADIFADVLLKQKYEEEYSDSFLPARDDVSLVQLARFFKEQTPFSGFAPVTCISESMTVDLLWFLRMSGVEITDAQSLKNLDLSKVERALTLYRELHEQRPSGTDDWFVHEVNDAFIRGEVPQVFQWTSLMEKLEDPLYSRVEAATGFLPLPRNDNGEYTSITGSWFLCIPKSNTKKRELAVEFSTWWRNQTESHDSSDWDKVIKAAATDSWSRPRLKNYKLFSKILSEEAGSLALDKKEPKQVTLQLVQRLQEFIEVTETPNL